MSSEKDTSSPRSVLVVFAHPDDAEFTYGGTVAKWATQGTTIPYAVATDGSKGGPAEMTPAELVRRRQEELQVSAWNRSLGEPLGLGYAEGFKLLQPHCEICR